MNKNTLGEFLLSKFSGTVLVANWDSHPNPVTVGKIDPLDYHLCEDVRFELKDKVPIMGMCGILTDYYTSIEWKNKIWILEGEDTIVGDVWPAETETVLGIFGAYETEEPYGKGRETNVFHLTLCPVIR